MVRKVVGVVCGMYGVVCVVCRCVIVVLCAGVLVCCVWLSVGGVITGVLRDALFENVPKFRTERFYK